MRVLLCREAEDQFSSYLDGSLTGRAMAEVQEHLVHCAGCRGSFGLWKATVGALAQMGSAKAPESLALQLRVAISQEKTRTPARAWSRLQVRWQNTLRPLVLQASAGFASAVLLVGTMLLLIGTFAAPPAATATDDPPATASLPRLLYTALPDGSYSSTTVDGSVVVRVYVDAAGRVYDYRVLSGNADERSRAALANEMMWSVFEPAHVFGEPVRGSVILSLAGVSVPG
jgi:anti-sigma factor RsiW